MTLSGNGSKECFVTNEHGVVKTLDAFMKEEENVTKYEFVRKNVLSATMHFNKRVQEFIKTIVMAKAEFHKMPVTYYNYRVEFQQRGKGGCQKRFSGFFPLRGYPPPP